jgi:pyruvate, orthophosphate dikinase
MTTWLYSFDQSDQARAHAGEDWDAFTGLLGGKGANLFEMTRLGVPVPQGFTVTTEACNAYQGAGGEFPDGLWEQVMAALSDLEDRTGRRFGDAAAPLLVSCRSGAKFSMPGMMDTILNIGLNDQVTEGLAAMSGDRRFALDSHRRLIQMFGNVVLGIDTEAFEHILTERRRERRVATDAELDAHDLEAVVSAFKRVVVRHARIGFPGDPRAQLEMAIRAVFDSWNSRRARDYREAAHIPHDLGTAVNVVAMVFGNLDDDSCTGVAMSRNATTGENLIEGDYLVNAQGEDVVAGIRATRPLTDLAAETPAVWEEFAAVAKRLEHHYRDMQDIEFTVESGKLWILQTRSGKRTAQAAVRIAVEMAEEGLISKEDALLRVEPDQIDFFLHPQFSAEARTDAQLIASGLNVSPGAATGQVAFDADLAQRWARTEERRVLLVRPETRPDDVHGMLAAEGILTSSGGRTSHAALVARQFGKPAVVGAAELAIDLQARTMTVDGLEIHEGDWVSIDGATGDVYLGELATVVPDLDDDWLSRLLAWADEHRRLGVRANADYPEDAARARRYGAEGIGLCRTEHMFFEPERLPIVRRMIMTESRGERREALAALLPYQREDFAGLFRAMDGLPVIIRLIDPPLHEFLPSVQTLIRELADAQIRITNAGSLAEVEELTTTLGRTEAMLHRLEQIAETNPMLGLRGVRLGIMLPELTRMQVRAVFEAACEVTREGVRPVPKIMIPLTSHANELRRQREVLESEARAVMEEQGTEIEYEFGTMVEVPRAALTADRIADHAEFLSFGTNDLTQTTFGMSRDDAEAGFLRTYLAEEILPENPFATLDADGVGRLIEITLAGARSTRPDIEVGVCGEHGGDPASIALCDRLGVDYVSCSPFRVPVARLAAAQSALRAGGHGGEHRD